MQTQDLLFEMGCEELPAKGLQTFSKQFAVNLTQLLQQASLTFSAYHYFATPRRIAVIIKDLVLQQPIRHVTKKGPAITANDLALQGFLRHAAVQKTDLVQRENYWYLEQSLPGKTLFDLLPHFIHTAITQLAGNQQWMHWGKVTQSFWRPVNWLVLLWGEQVIPAQFFGCNTNRITYSHRLQYPQKLVLTQARDYVDILLEEGRVIVDFDQRQAMIRQQLATLVQKHKAIYIEDPVLLAEVTGLTEWPITMVGQFDPQFLTIPQEIIVSAITQHQKCFVLLDKSEKLLPRFMIVTNNFIADDIIIKGNQRVMQARLSDAAFFWQQDQKKSLLELATPLTKIIFQQKLGTVADKIKRLISLSGIIATWLHVDSAKAQNVAKFSKIDLASAVVNEFPELQGTMGYYLTKNHGESEEIALAVRDQYLPLPHQSWLPKNALGCVIALADRIDTLAGIFGIGLLPTGDKDPFALRRAANGIIRLIIEKSLNNIFLDQLIDTASQQYANHQDFHVDHRQLLETFILERLPAYFQAQQYTLEMIEAVLTVLPAKNRSLVDIEQRLAALAQWLELPETNALTNANKRVKNILKKNSPLSLSWSFDQCLNVIKQNLLQLPAEQALYQQIIQQKTFFVPEKDYVKKLISLINFKAPLETFFAEVMVIVDDDEVRQNRLALLQGVRILFLQVADIALLALEKT